MNYMLRLRKIIKSTIDSSIYYYIILLTVFVIGTVVGSLLIKVFSNNTTLRFINLTTPYIGLDLYGLELFNKSLIINFLFIGISFLLGLINIGFLSTLLTFIRGSILGLSVGFIIKNYGGKGFFIAVLGIYPQYIIYLPCIIFAGVLAILYDTRTNSINRKKHRMVKINLSDYIILLILIIFIMTIGSLYEGFISPIFFKL